MAGQRLEISVLGGLVLTIGADVVEVTAAKQRLLLAALVLERDRVVPTDRLIDIVWPDGIDDGAAALQVYVSRLRGVMEPDRRPRQTPQVLITQNPGYRLSVERDRIDLHRFEHEVAAGVEALRAGSFEDALDHFERGLDDWKGALLPEFADQPIVIAAAQRADETRSAAIEGAAEARLALGDTVGALALLHDAAAEHPTREHLHALLARALYRHGRQAESLRVIDDCRRARSPRSPVSTSVRNCAGSNRTSCTSHPTWTPHRHRSPAQSSP